MSYTYKRLRRGWETLQRRFKENVTIQVKSTTYDDNDVPTDTYTSTSTKAIVYGTMDEYSQTDFAHLQNGDYIFLFDNDETITQGDSVIHQTIVYTVRRVEPLDTQGGLVGLVVYTQRGESN